MKRFASGVPVAVVLCGVSAGVSGCRLVVPPADPGGPGGTTDTELVFETVVANAAFPVAMAFAPDGRAFYTEKETGRVRVISAEGELLEEPFADVTVVANSERGLLGIALHSAFGENGYVYVYYTKANTNEDTRLDSAAVDNRVVRFTAEGDAGTDETLILTLPVEPGPNHDGGNIHFGPDGKLYVTIGELARSENSQDIDALPGRILRINDDGTIPEDNPFGAGNPTYALGLRNSFDFAFDPASGVIFATENGTNLHDEVNRLLPGANGGWPLVEGRAGDAVIDVERGSYVDPTVEYTSIVVPTGIAFAPDDTYGAEAEGGMFVGEFLTGRINRFTLSEDRASTLAGTRFAQGIPGGITDLVFAPDGTLYVLTSISILRALPATQGE